MSSPRKRWLKIDVYYFIIENKITMNMIRIGFKICYETETIVYEIPGHWTTEYTFHKIRDNLCEDFDIPNTFHIVPGPGLQTTQHAGYAEDHPPVEMRADQSMTQYCNPNEMNVFYIRFLEEPTFYGNNIRQLEHIN
jgi:hypothetical protein